MRTIIKIALAVIILLLILFTWNFLSRKSLLPNLPNTYNNTSGEQYFLTGSDYQGNYIYGGAMQLAFNELNDSIINGKLQLDLDESNTDAKRLLTIFNKSEFTKSDLDEKSYYIKSGYGQETVDTINRESRSKFPNKSFGDLKLKLGPRDIISYAYFLKQIEYTTEFEKGTVDFLGASVKGFRAGREEQIKTVKIVEYKNDDNFIVMLNLKDSSDEIYLAKGYDMKNPYEAIGNINSDKTTSPMGLDDLFEAPEIHLDMSRDYRELIEKKLLNEGFENYFIKAMSENIKFDMDNKGARVENEAHIYAASGAIQEETPRIKKLILDKPYWVIMKRSSSPNPFFILGVKNTQVLSR